MNTRRFDRLSKTDPPSTAFILVPECEADTAIIAELHDQPYANRAPNPKVQQRGIHGRIVVNSLAAQLEIKALSDPLPEDVRSWLGEAAIGLGIDPETMLKKAFCVTFFAW